MKTLSFKQPFAELILQRRKKIELRTRNTHFRGEFLIHASAKSDVEAMAKFGFAVGSLPLGRILGKANLVDVKKYETEEEHKRDKELHLADSGWGDYGLVLADVERFDKSIPAKGKLGFWDYVCDLDLLRGYKGNDNGLLQT